MHFRLIDSANASFTAIASNFQYLPLNTGIESFLEGSILELDNLVATCLSILHETIS